MMKSAVTCLILLIAYTAQGAPSGAIRICRAPGIVGLHQQDTISIPAASLVRDAGPVDGKQTGYDRNARDPQTWRHVRLQTTEAATLEKGKTCVSIPASIKENKAGGPVVASDRRLYAPVGSGWATLATYDISVVADFQ